MSSNGLDHPLVRGYLHDLDAALSALPADRATELREQITAHLDEALKPGADDGEVAATLGRLGSPADLATEAGAATDAPAQSLFTFGSLARTKLARVRRRTWVLVCIALVLIGTGTGYLTVLLSAGDLQSGPTSFWWYSQDAAREVDTSADSAQQTTVPIRSGQQQGLAVDLYNPTDWTQTVVGLAADQGSPGSTSPHVGISVPNRTIEDGGSTRDIGFTMPGSIPPHQIRLLRLLWISDICLPGRGYQAGIDELNLRVRVGWFTRTETIPLNEGWYVSGPSHGPCS